MSWSITIGLTREKKIHQVTGLTGQTSPPQVGSNKTPYKPTNPANDILEKDIGLVTGTSAKEVGAEPDPEGI
jgi:hypothetical protein